MSCLNQTFTIVRGEDKEIIVRLIDKETHDPITLDVTVTEIVAKFQGDGQTITKTLTLSGGITVVTAATGKFKIVLTDTDTLLLAVGKNKSFEVVVTKSGIVSIVQFLSILEVNDSVVAS